MPRCDEVTVLTEEDISELGLEEAPEDIGPDLEHLRDRLGMGPPSPAGVFDPAPPAAFGL